MGALPGQGAKVPLHGSRPERLLRRIASVPNAVLEQSAVQRAIAAFRAPLSFHSQFISKEKQLTLENESGNPSPGRDQLPTVANNVLPTPMLRRTSSDVSERVDDLIVVQPAAGGVQTQTLSRWRQAGESPVILLPNQGKGVNGRALPGYPGVQTDHEALQVVRERAHSHSKPGKRQDSFKLGLVVEGGGMRGAVSGGSLMALIDLGLKDCFDAVYGSSAGAINGTYFLTSQREGVDIYWEDIANKQFCDLKRLLTKRTDDLSNESRVLNLSFLLDYVMNEVKPLKWEEVLSSPIPLKVVASSLDLLQPVILQDFTSKEDLFQCLRASAMVPEIAGGPLIHRGQRLVDAAVFEPVPFRAAIADGCTHIIALCTRPPVSGGRIQRAFSDVISNTIKRAVMSPDYMRAAWAQEIANLEADGISPDEMLLSGLEPGSHTQPYFAGAHVYPIFPHETAPSVSPMCTDVPQLQAGVQEGFNLVLRTFEPLLVQDQVFTHRRLQEDPYLELFV